MTQVRPLDKDDFEDVLDISKSIWNGHDYLPKVFEEWIEDPDSHVFGIVINDKVVSIANLRVIDQGTTGWMEGLRVHVDYRGQGLANKITDHLVQEAKKLKLQRLRYTTAASNVESLAIAYRVGMKELFRMGIFWDDVYVSFGLEGNHEGIEKIRPDNLFSIVDRIPIMDNIIIQDWKAIEVTKEGIDTLGEKNEFWISEKSGVTLSIGGIRKESSGPYWSFTVYSDTWEGLENHMSFQYAQAKERGFDAVVCTYPIEFKEEVLPSDIIDDYERKTEVIMLEKNI